MTWKWTRRRANRSPKGSKQVELLRQELQATRSIEAPDKEDGWDQKLLRAVFAPTTAPRSRFRDAVRRGWAHASGLLRFLPWRWARHRRMTAPAAPFSAEPDTQKMEQEPR